MDLLGALTSLIDITTEQQAYINANTAIFKATKGQLIAVAGQPVNEVIYMNSGLCRVIAQTAEGEDLTTHFAYEGQFICDYSSYLTSQPADYSIQALEDVSYTLISRALIDWTYQHVAQGHLLGKKIAEYYFIYLDYRIKGLYLLSPVERYERLEQTFPGIQNRVPQYMLASYLGITPVHLSRIKAARRAAK